MSDPILIALTGAGATVVVALIGAVLGRRWGLPGLGRMVENEQRELIDVLQGRIEALEDLRADDQKRLASLESCQDKVADLERQLREAHADIVGLGRKVNSLEASRTRQRNLRQ